MKEHQLPLSVESVRLFLFQKEILFMLFNFIHDVELNARGISIGIRRTLENYTNRFSLMLFLVNLNNDPLSVRGQDETENDFLNRKRDWLERKLNAAHTIESSRFSSSHHRIFREEAVNIKLFNELVGQRGSDNTDINTTNRFAPARITTSSRQRTFDSVPVAFLIYVGCTIIASSEVARGHINKFAANGRIIPRYLSEQLSCTRQSNIGNIFITPTVLGLDPVLISELKLQNTIFDAEYLTSEIGVTAFLEMCSRLSMTDGNYIDFAKFEKPVPFISGNTTTFMAFSNVLRDDQSTHGYLKTEFVKNKKGEETATSSTDFISTSFASHDYLTMLPNHSYGNMINGVQLFDARVQMRVIFDSQSNAIGIGVYSPTNFYPSSSTQQLFAFIVDRVANENKLENDPKRRTGLKERETLNNSSFDNAPAPVTPASEGRQKKDSNVSKFFKTKKKVFDPSKKSLQLDNHPVIKRLDSQYHRLIDLMLQVIQNKHFAKAQFQTA